MEAVEEKEAVADNAEEADEVEESYHQIEKLQELGINAGGKYQHFDQFVKSTDITKLKNGVCI